METKEVKGLTCVVIHISVDNKIGTAICHGQKFEIPPQDDRRPKTLCEDCRQTFLKGKN